MIYVSLLSIYNNIKNYNFIVSDICNTFPSTSNFKASPNPAQRRNQDNKQSGIPSNTSMQDKTLYNSRKVNNIPHGHGVEAIDRDALPSVYASMRTGNAEFMSAPQKDGTYMCIRAISGQKIIREKAIGTLMAQNQQTGYASALVVRRRTPVSPGQNDTMGTMLVMLQVRRP